MILFCFRCVFTAFVSLQSLHSSLNASGGLGVASLSCIYGATVLSSFVAPPVIHRLTTKWTIAAGFLLFVIYFTINFFPFGLMLIPASLLLGFLTGPLWSAQGTYLTTLAIRYAQSTQQVHEPVINKFNGIFTSIYQASQILGHLISIIVLSFNPNNPPDYRYNFQYTHIDRYVAINKTWHSYNLNCGSHGCGMQEFPNDDVILHEDASVPFHIRNLLLGIHVGFTVLGLTLTVTLLDKGEVMVTEGKHPLSTSSHQLFLATLHMFQDPRLQLLLPLVLFIGLDQGFVFGDFTKVKTAHWIFVFPETICPYLNYLVFLMPEKSENETLSWSKLSHSYGHFKSRIWQYWINLFKSFQLQIVLKLSKQTVSLIYCLVYPFGIRIPGNITGTTAQQN